MKLRIVERTSPRWTTPVYVVQYKKRFPSYEWRDRRGEFPTQADAEGTVNKILTRDVVVRVYK